MNVVIAGAGNAGRKLAGHMRGARFELTMLDSSQDALAEAADGFDAMMLQGSATDPAALARAGAGAADLFVALTNDEEANVLACILAKHGGAKRVIAKLTSARYEAKTPMARIGELGVDLAINQKAAVADEIHLALALPGAVESFDLFEGRAIVAGFPVAEGSPVVGLTPAGIPDRDLVGRTRFIAVMRRAQVIIPRGDTVFMPGDIVYIAGAAEDARRFSAWLEPGRRPFKKVVVAGGGTGLFVAEKLEAMGGVECVLLEQNEERAAFCAERLDKTLVLRADALSGSTLDETGMPDVETAFVAVTGDDERNVMSCLMARKKRAAFSVTQIVRTEYVPIVEKLGVVNRVLNPFESIARGIMHYLRSNNVRAVALLHNLPGELLDVEVSAGHKFAGKALREIKFPRDMNVAVALRRGGVVPANGDFVAAPGDRLLVFAGAAAAARAENLFLS